MVSSPKRLRAARLVEGRLRPLIGDAEAPPRRSRALRQGVPEGQERLVLLWRALKPAGRRTLLLAARLIAIEEGALPRESPLLDMD